jgi:hypothetical protein
MLFLFLVAMEVYSFDARYNYAIYCDGGSL